MFVVKKTEEHVNKTFRFPEGLIERLDKAAKRHRVSMNELLKQMAEYTLNEMEKMEGEKKPK